MEDLVLVGAPAGPAGLVLRAVAVGDDDELGGVDELVAAARVAAEARQREIGEVALGAGAGDLDAVAVLAADADDLQVGVVSSSQLLGRCGSGEGVRGGA